MIFYLSLYSHIHHTVYLLVAWPTITLTNYHSVGLYIFVKIQGGQFEGHHLIYLLSLRNYSQLLFIVPWILSPSFPTTLVLLFPEFWCKVAFLHKLRFNCSINCCSSWSADKHVGLITSICRTAYVLYQRCEPNSAEYRPSMTKLPSQYGPSDVCWVTTEFRILPFLILFTHTQPCSISLCSWSPPYTLWTV